MKLLFSRIAGFLINCMPDTITRIGALVIAAGTCLFILPILNKASAQNAPVKEPAAAVTYFTEEDLDARSYRKLIELRKQLKPRALQNFEAALLEIQNTIRPDLYGLGKKFTYPLVKNQNNEIFLLSDLGNAGNRNFDCLDAAITVKNILKKHHIRSDVYKGSAEQALFDTHYFVITEDRVTIDGTPVFPLLGAEHTVTLKVPDKEIRQYIEKGFSKIGGVRPLSFSREGAMMYNSLLGVEDNPQSIIKMIETMNEESKYPGIVFQYQLNEFKDDMPHRRYIMTVTVTLENIKRFLLKKVNEETDGYARYREMSIAQLAEAGAIAIQEEGRIMETANRMTMEKPVKVQDINDLKERAQKDMPIAAEFLKNVVYTTYLIQII